MSSTNYIYQGIPYLFASSKVSTKNKGFKATLGNHLSIEKCSTSSFIALNKYDISHPNDDQDPLMMPANKNKNTNDNGESRVVLCSKLFKVFEDGRFEPRFPTKKIPPSADPILGIQSKDVIISTTPSISARIFMPIDIDSNEKLPLLYYIHGGSFCMQSAFSPVYNRYHTRLAAEAKIIIVSIEYRLYQESPLPSCYEDCWAGLQWVVNHSNANGPDPFLNNHVDFTQLFVAGDSAGANLAHFVVAKVGLVGLSKGIQISGLILVHPVFGGSEDDWMWFFMFPTNLGLNDPRMKPNKKDLARLGCKRVLLFKAEKDTMGFAADEYYEKLKNSGWKGFVEIVENKGKSHAFHLIQKNDPESKLIQNRICAFLKQD